MFKKNLNLNSNPREDGAASSILTLVHALHVCTRSFSDFYAIRFFFLHNRIVTDLHGPCDGQPMSHWQRSIQTAAVGFAHQMPITH